MSIEVLIPKLNFFAIAKKPDADERPYTATTSSNGENANYGEAPSVGL